MEDQAGNTTVVTDPVSVSQSRNSVVEATALVCF